jgi:hypothetical protein
MKKINISETEFLTINTTLTYNANIGTAFGTGKYHEIYSFSTSYPQDMPIYFQSDTFSQNQDTYKLFSRLILYKTKK